MAALAALALRGTLAADGFEFFFEFIDALLHFAAVSFQLRFAFTAAHADAAFLPRQVRPEAREAREQPLELGEFDLQFAFAGAGPLGEDVEDQRGAIEDFDGEDLFEIAILRWGKFVVEDDGVDGVFLTELRELLGLAGADESGRAGFVEFLNAVPDDFTAGGFGEFIQLSEGILDIEAGAIFEFNADEENSLRFPSGCVDQ